MKLVWESSAWEDYLYWQHTDKKMLRRVNELIRDVVRHPFEGVGKPEPLKNQWQGFWSRRIDKVHRLVYFVSSDTVTIAQCRYHY